MPDNDSIDIRAESAADKIATAEVVTQAFGEHGRVIAQLVESFRASPAWDSALSFAAHTPDGRVIGHILVTRNLLDAPRRLVDVLVVSSLAVLPAYQGRGVGSQLVRHALKVMTTRPEPLAFLEGSPAYYSRFGFEPAVRKGFRRPSLRIPEPAFMVKLFPSFQPWMTGTLVYAEPFWRHDCVWPARRTPGHLQDSPICTAHSLGALSPGDTDLMTCHQGPRTTEVPLPAGRMTSGIVRRGDRLLRPMGPWSPAVQEYLRHLEAAGFEGAPRVLGIEGDREVLTFIDGDVADDPQWQPGHGNRLPPYARTELALQGAAELIRNLHQAAGASGHPLPATVSTRIRRRPGRSFPTATSAPGTPSTGME